MNEFKNSLAGTDIVANFLTTILYTVLAAIIQFMMSFMSISSGTIIANEPINIKNDTYLSVVDIINTSDDIVKDIGIELPGELLEINSSIPLDYKVENYKNGRISKILVNTVHEKSNYQIIAKYKKNVESTIVISNYKTNHLTLTNKSNYLNPRKDFYIKLGLSSFILGLLLALMTYYLKKETNELKTISENLKNEIKSKVSSDALTFEDLNKRIANAEYRLLKQRLLYTARIGDYKKELSFWRDTIRKVINNETKSEKVIDEITTNLKTYKTLETLESDELKYLEIAELIVENKNKKAD